jgi:hypothetical protein
MRGTLMIFRRGLLAAGVCTALATQSVAAQSRPVVYQHGLLSDSSTWNTTSARLS